MQDIDFKPEIYGFRKVSQCHWYENYQCPYNPDHIVQHSRCQYHIVKCAQKYGHLGMITCPFNATHIVTKKEHQYHIQHCPDRTVIDSNCFTDTNNTLIILKKIQHGNTDVPAYEMSEEDYYWDHVWEAKESSEKKCDMKIQGPNLCNAADDDNADDGAETDENCINDGDKDDVISVISHRKPRCDPLILKMNQVELVKEVSKALPDHFSTASEVDHSDFVDKLSVVNSMRKPHTESLLLSIGHHQSDKTSESFLSSSPSHISCPDLESHTNEDACSISVDSGRGLSLTHSGSRGSLQKRDMKAERLPGKTLPVTTTTNIVGLGRGGQMCVGFGRGCVRS